MTEQASEPEARLELLPPKRAAEVLEKLSAREAAAAIASLPSDALGRVVEALPTARAAQVIAAFDPDTRARVLAAMPQGLARKVSDFLLYPQDTAGALMDQRLTLFQTTWSVDDALARLRTFKIKEFDSIFVVDDNERLVGAVPLAELVTAAASDKLGALVRGAPTAVIVSATRDELVAYLGDRPVTALPVVDANGRLVGVIRHSTLLGAQEAVATAGLQTMVGAGKDETALSPVLYAVRQRLPWLETNLATAFLAAFVVGLFEGTIAQFTALAVLLPVVAGQSGNSGMQALAVSMRSLALRQIRIGDWPRIVIKECGVGILNGLGCAATTAIAVFLWSRSIGLTLVIGIAMVVAMVIAGMSGAAIPLLLKALRQDPAQSSSIVLTTVTDVAGFLTFLGLATIFSGIL